MKRRTVKKKDMERRRMNWVDAIPQHDAISVAVRTSKEPERKLKRKIIQHMEGEA